jgi:hypothetical protein
MARRAAGRPRPRSRENPAVVDLQLVIFDCDGVLVDSEVISNEVLARSLTALGLPTTLAEARRDYQGLLLVRGRRARAGQAWTCASRGLAGPLRTGARRDLPSRPAARCGRRRGDQADQRRRRGRLRRVAGQAREDGTLTRADGTRSTVPALRPVFRRVRDAWQAAPDLFLRVASVMRAEPAGCFVVEDTPSGVTAAIAAGMFGYTADSDEAAMRAASSACTHSRNYQPS